MRLFFDGERFRPAVLDGIAVRHVLGRAVVAGGDDAVVANEDGSDRAAKTERSTANRQRDGHEVLVVFRAARGHLLDS